MGTTHYIGNNFDATYFISFSLEHRNDWTRTTRGVPARFESLCWQPVDNETNFEVLLADWNNRVTGIECYIQELTKRGKIYETLSIKQILKHVYVVSFIGPYQNTVRENLQAFNAVTYDSTIINGHQLWTVVLPKDKTRGFVECVKRIGSINIEERKRATSKDVLRIALNRSLTSKLADLALTKKEAESVELALKHGYFDKTHKVKIEDLATLRNRNKSTVDRELRSGLRKLLVPYFILERACA
jgi:predicted DNA binding protein